MSIDLQVSLDDELRGVGRTRVNALPSIVAERFAAIRWRLERVNRAMCDGYATDETPELVEGTPVEVKAVRVFHHDGVGRIGVHVNTHRELLEAGGRYAIVLYDEVVVDGEERILVLEASIVNPEELDRFVPAGTSDYQKVRWNLVLESDPVDLSRRRCCPRW